MLLKLYLAVIDNLTTFSRKKISGFVKENFFEFYFEDMKLLTCFFQMTGLKLKHK